VRTRSWTRRPRSTLRAAAASSKRRCPRERRVQRGPP
jgi:hypothetical protein